MGGWPSIEPRSRWAGTAVVAAIGYAVLRMATVGRWQAVAMRDTFVYERLSKLPVFSRGFLAGIHPPVEPFLMKLTGTGSLHTIAMTQAAIATVAWLCLAVAVGISVRHRWLRVVAIALVLTLSLSDRVVQWDGAALTESISVSLFVMLVAGILVLVQRWRWVIAVPTIAVALLWGMTRDANSFVLATTAVAIAGLIVVRRLPRSWLALVAVCLVAFIGANWSANAARRWQHGFYDVIGQRVLTSASRTGFFRDRGMPTPPELLRLAGKFDSLHNFPFERDPELASFRRWVHRHGRQTYGEYLASHPGWALSGPFSRMHLRLTVLAPLDVYEPTNFHHAVPRLIQVLVFPLNAAIFYTEVTLIFLVGLAMAWKRPSSLLSVSIAVVVLATVNAFVSWHADANEISRHMLGANVALRLGTWTLLVAVLDGLLSAQASTTSSPTETGPGAWTTP